MASVALTYRATVDVPARFRKSKVVGAVFGVQDCCCAKMTGKGHSACRKSML
jgi:hypothetical protein